MKEAKGRGSAGAGAEAAAAAAEPRECGEAEGGSRPAGYSLTFREAALELLGPEAVRAVVAGLIGKASGGDVRAYETLRELAGEALPDMEELQVRLEVVE